MPARPPAPHKLAWFKSSYSGANTTECVECACADHGTFIRDSKREEGPAVLVQPRTWRAFIQALVQNKFD